MRALNDVKVARGTCGCDKPQPWPCAASFV